jgi:hypothetical protein
MAQPADGHNCFEVNLPELPRGYRFDTQRPMQLVPFNAFHGHIAPIPVCRRCYIYAISNFDLVQVNALSARATMIDPAAIALAGLARFSPMVNAVGHPMYEDLYPVAPREGRTLVLIERHYARVGTPTRMPVLQYRIKYSIANDPNLHRWTTATEIDTRRYNDSWAVMQDYWYGDRAHKINEPFIHAVLTALTPGANTAIWSKLPYEEAAALWELWRIKRLEVWEPGMTLRMLRAREDLA